MNKRQAKKAHKKIAYPILDEVNLLTLNEEEYKKAIQEFTQFAWKHWRFTHYKDRYKILRKANYHFPVGESKKKYYEKILKTVGRYNIEPIEVVQSLEQIKHMYSGELPTT